MRGGGRKRGCSTQHYARSSNRSLLNRRRRGFIRDITDTTRNPLSHLIVTIRLTSDPFSPHARLPRSRPSYVSRTQRNFSRRALARSLTTPDGGHYGNESPAVDALERHPSTIARITRSLPATYPPSIKRARWGSASFKCSPAKKRCESLLCVLREFCSWRWFLRMPGN